MQYENHSFGFDMLICPRCQGKMRLVAMVKEGKALEKILTHIGIDPTPPKLAPARAPPQLELDAFIDEPFDDECADWQDDAA